MSNSEVSLSQHSITVPHVSPISLSNFVLKIRHPFLVSSKCAARSIQLSFFDLIILYHANYYTSSELCIFIHSLLLEACDANGLPDPVNFRSCTLCFKKRVGAGNLNSFNGSASYRSKTIFCFITQINEVMNTIPPSTGNRTIILYCLINNRRKFNSHYCEKTALLETLK